MHIEIVIGRKNKTILRIYEDTVIYRHMTDTPLPYLNEDMVATNGAVSSSQLCKQKGQIIALIIAKKYK